MCLTVCAFAVLHPTFSLVARMAGFMGGTDYRCKINDQTPIEATYDADSDSIRCRSNLWAGMNYVEVTLNGREYTSDGLPLPINHFWSEIGGIYRYDVPQLKEGGPS